MLQLYYVRIQKIETKVTATTNKDQRNLKWLDQKENISEKEISGQ